jgi:2-methylcitrate dehydratase PrpD
VRGSVTSAYPQTGEALAHLAERLCAVSYGAVDPAAQEAARQRILDTLAAAALGRHTPEGRLLERFASMTRDRGSSPDCRLHIGAARSTEVDDIDVASCTTVGSVVVPVAVALAATEAGTTSAALLAAIVVGYEAMTRLGRAIGGATLLYRGIWPTYVTAAFAAAATAAKLLDLDATATARALALALTRTSSTPRAALARFGYRCYSLGAAAADGIDAAVAAAAGVDADLDGLAPFAERLGATLDLVELSIELGRPWRVAAVDTKPWPCARQTLSSVAAFRQLAMPALDAIERIVVRVPVAYRAMIDRAELPAQRIESLLSVQYQLGLAAFAPAVLDDALRRSLPTDSRIEALMRKVSVEADAELGARFPSVWGSRVTLVPRSGAPVSSEVLAPPGSGAQALEWADLTAKFARVFSASGLRGGAALAALERCCEGLGREGDGRDVARELLAVTDALAPEGGATMTRQKSPRVEP